LLTIDLYVYLIRNFIFETLNYFIDKNISIIDKIDKKVLYILQHEVGDIEILTLLLHLGAQVTQKDIYGSTALKKNYFHLVPNLLLFGSNINARDNGMFIVHLLHMVKHSKKRNLLKLIDQLLLHYHIFL